ncbi:hypothetical protein [Granulicella mallensis]|uniref:Uncharacterized protein n=1 Tax=Granulicella mallensis TaxID=940614 RepID=A0A7W7ZR52_9BACT|nr:hypothetical protein [Granulicella mallensis]MBB5064569.1 hypothetical protein [Granulicella mallensis]
MNIFSEVVKGLTWVGKELAIVPDWIKKVVTVTNDVEKDAEILLPETVLIIEDVDALVVAAVKDSGSAITSAENLVAAITTAAKADALNISDDEAVLVAFKAFIAEVTTSSNYVDVIAAEKKLVVDFDGFKGDAVAALQKLEADV